MSFPSDSRSSPPVKDPGLGSPSLSILKKTLHKEAQNLYRMELGLLSPEQIYNPTRKRLFSDDPEYDYEMVRNIALLIY